MNLSNRERDDLTLIKGIGPARQRWFKRALDVHTYRDLAALSVDEIESRLKADKQIVSRGSIEAWIAQAHQREKNVKHVDKVTKTTKTTNTKEKSEILDRRNDDNPGTTQLAEDYTEGKLQSPVRRDGWKPFASFIVEYQKRTNKGQVEYRTTAHHMEADSSTSWPGIEGRQHCHWMLEQLGNRESKKPLGNENPTEGYLEKTIHQTRSSGVVRITQIRTFQPQEAKIPLETGKPDQPFRKHIICDIPFALEIRFELAGEAVTDIAQEQIGLRARAYVQEQATGEGFHLGDIKSDIVANSERAYTTRIPNIILPVGTYCLFAIVMAQSESITPDFVTLPEFKVAS